MSRNIVKRWSGWRMRIAALAMSLMIVSGCVTAPGNRDAFKAVSASSVAAHASALVALGDTPEEARAISTGRTLIAEIEAF